MIKFRDSLYSDDQVLSEKTNDTPEQKAAIKEVNKKLKEFGVNLKIKSYEDIDLTDIITGASEISTTGSIVVPAPLDKLISGKYNVSVYAFSNRIKIVYTYDLKVGHKTITKMPVTHEYIIKSKKWA